MGRDVSGGQFTLGDAAADGAVMPGAVGPNPSWTIAALANLFATAMLGEE